VGWRRSWRSLVVLRGVAADEVGFRRQRLWGTVVVVRVVKVGVDLVVDVDVDVDVWTEVQRR
jgi:hypothetical protein